MNLVEALEQGAQKTPEKGLRVLHDDTVAEHVTFAQLYRDAGETAGALAGLGVRPLERVAIALPNSVAYAQALFGVLAVGAVAVPLPPPYRFASLDIHLRRIALALRQSRVRFVLSDELMTAILAPAFAAIDDGLEVLDIARLDRSGSDYARLSADGPALVQYTSGTSGDPKGVVLTHANIRANVDAITTGLRVAPGDIGCSWLPLFHDMGLIGHLLVPVASGNDLYLLKPEDFLRRPGNWLRAISQFGATVSSAPSSAYAHCLRHITDEEVEALDLSSWRVALNGAEAIDCRIMREFARKFSPAGFSANAFLPVYGLAEATLAVSFAPTGRAARTIRVSRESLSRGKLEPAPRDNSAARELISVGTPVRETQIRLIGEHGEPVSDNHVGEIQVRGASVTAGYEHLPTNHDGLVLPDGWVRTGDLGAITDGELYIVGRTKETIIIMGQNYYASDIESVTAAVPGIPSRGVLAVGTPDTEGDDGALVVFIEMDDPAADVGLCLQDSVRRAVSQSHGITPKDIFFVPKGRIERTSSGKLRRDGIDLLLRECLAAS